MNTVGLDQATNTGLAVVTPNKKLLHHEVIQPGTKKDYKTPVDMVMDVIERNWLPCYVQAEKTYHGYQRTKTFLDKLLVRLETKCEDHPDIIWLPPVSARDINKFFSLSTAIAEYIADGESKRNARKEAMKDATDKLFGIRLGDDEADAALHALYGLHEVQKLETLF